MGLDDFLKNKESLSGFKKESEEDIISLDTDIMIQELKNGVRVADHCCVDYMSKNFAWMRGHQNCWTGFPNDGKTQFTLYMMIIKSIRSNWKWVIWSPEMKSANFIDGKVKVHYNILAYEIMATLTGKTPYRHINEKYKIPICSQNELLDSAKWIEDHFIFLDPKKKDITSIFNRLKQVYEDKGFDGILIDPFKNIEAEHNVRDDKHLHDIFSKFKDLAVETNTVMNWIAHPKSNVNRIINGQLMPCNQYMLAGGAAWDNSMDGIYSVFRPDMLSDMTSTRVQFLNLKQRMQELTSERGIVDLISFDVKKRRYIFNDIDPIDKCNIESSDVSFDYESGDVFKKSDTSKEWIF